MKKFIIIIIFSLLTAIFTGCIQASQPISYEPAFLPEALAGPMKPDVTEITEVAKEPEPVPEPTPVSAKMNIVCTVFPQYDWVREILGENIHHHNVELLTDNFIDLHSYQPSVDDIVKIISSDLFIYVGGMSDQWVDDVLRQAFNPDMIVVNLLEYLGNAVKTDTLTEMTHDDDHGHTHCHDHDHAHDDDCEEHCEDDRIHEDEHVWLSLRNAAVFCETITHALTALLPDYADEFHHNCYIYTGKLHSLDMEYQAAVDSLPVRTLLFADRFPFRYLLDDYGINYYAAFSGCSAETEASFGTIVFLATKMDELRLNNVLVTESADQSIARTVISSTADKNQQILILNAMQSVTRADIQNGATFLSIMENNLDVLKKALN